MANDASKNWWRIRRAELLESYRGLFVHEIGAVAFRNGLFVLAVGLLLFLDKTLDVLAVDES